MRYPNKAAHIRALIGLPTSEVAKKVGVRKEYVRTVRQRTSSDGSAVMSRADQRWVLAHPPPACQNPPSHWSEAEDQVLFDRYGKPGHSAYSIAVALNRTRNEVIGRANRLGLCKPHPRSQFREIRA